MWTSTEPGGNTNLDLAKWRKDRTSGWVGELKLLKLLIKIDPSCQNKTSRITFITN